jgi:hypothetical protein
MAGLRCQGAGMKLLSSSVGLAISFCVGITSAEAMLVNDPAVVAAMQFFDALDRNDREDLLQFASPDVIDQTISTSRVRQLKFGSRWTGDRGIREVIRVERDGEGEIVTLRAKYEAATLQQVAYVVCAPRCRITAVKEGPAPE